MPQPNYGLGNQTYYPLNADRAFAGLAVYTDKVDTYTNIGTTQQSVAIAIGTAANSTAYTITTLGQTVSITSDDTATAAEIGAALVAALRANSVIGSRFAISAADGTTGDFTMAARSYGFDTAVVTSGGGTGYAATNTASVQAATIGYGLVVIKSGTIDGQPGGALPRSSSDVIAGVTVATHGLPLPDATATDAAYRAGDLMSVMSRGTIWCLAEEQIAVNSTLYYRYSGGTLGMIAASSGTGKAALSGFRPAEASITLRDGTILCKVDVNLP
ncbi:MAG: structural cement protein Gp24 [Leptodesmis sp.]|uniref:structural cement protein Gp24 n=1 Tax=Leptodesmis sp. TaxID=3100501 RepID=UPI003D0BDFFA